MSPGLKAAEPEPVRITPSSFFVCIAWLAMTVGALAYVGLYGSAEPYLDDWDIVPAITGMQPVSWEWLWSQHNEHRLLLPRVLMLALLRLGHGDFRTGMLFNVVGMAVLSCVFIRLSASLRGRVSWTDACFPLLFLHWGHSDNFLWCWQVCFIASTLLVGLALILIASGRVPDSLGRIVAMDLCVIALALCGGSGLAFVPPLAVWLALAAFNRWRHGGVHDRRNGLAMLAGAIAGVLVLGLNFVGYRPAQMPPSPGPLAVFRTSIEFLSLSFGLFGTIDVYGLSNPRLLKDYWLTIAATVLTVYALAVVIAVYACRKRPKERLRALGMLLVIAGMLALAFGIGLGRSGFGEMSGLNRRYLSLTAPGVACIYLVFLLYAGRSALGLQAAILVMLALFAWPSAVEGRNFGSGLRIKFSHFEADVKTGLPPLIIADRYTRFPAAIRPRSEQESLVRELEALRQLGIGIFGRMIPDPDYHAIAAAQIAAQTEPHHFVLKRPQFVYAARVKYHYPGRKVGFSAVPFEFGWQAIDSSNSPGSMRGFGMALMQDTHDDFVHVWIDEPIMAFQFETGPDCEVLRVELLVP